MPPRLAPNQHPRNPARFPGPATKTVAAVFAHSRSMASQFHCPQICKDIRIGRPYACSSRCAQRASRSSMCLRSGGAAAFVLGAGAQRIHRCELPGRANASHGGPWDTGLTADACGSAVQVSGHIRLSACVFQLLPLSLRVCARQISRALISLRHAPWSALPWCSARPCRILLCASRAPHAPRPCTDAASRMSWCAHGDAALDDVFGGCLGALGDAAPVEVLVLDVRPSHKTIKPDAYRCIRTAVQSRCKGPVAMGSRPTAPHALLPRPRTAQGANHL